MDGQAGSTMADDLGLRPFHAMDVLGRARELEAEGREICHLEVGEPKAPPAPKVIEALQKAIAEPQRYTSSGGTMELRLGLAEYYRAQHGVAVDPRNLMVTMGSSAAFILAFLGGFAHGAKIAVTRPGYPAYLNTTDGLGYRAVEIPLTAANGWRLTGADIEAVHAREPFAGLLFASPANPTGASVDRAGLAEIVETCRRLGVRLISDEIYHGLDYRGPSVSALELTRDAIIINSFSKYYCMTGYRVGWMMLPDDLVERTLMLQQNLFISAPALSQLAATVALRERAYAEAQKAHYAANRSLLNDGLRTLGFADVREPDGAFYSFVDVSRFTNDSLRFCYELLDHAGVAAAPGQDFDRTNGHRYLRFCYAGATEAVERALERMQGFLKGR
jgi:aspartate/methionine/tyrosine aminotransferase